MKIGTGSAYLRGVPIRAGSQNAVNAMGVGTLVSSGGPHIESCNRSLYMVQCEASIPGAFGSVIKLPSTSPTSPSSLALSAATFSARTDGNILPPGAALNITSGFADPPSPLPGIITAGASTAAHTATWTFYNEAGTLVTEAVSITGPGTFTTVGHIKTSISYVTSANPVGDTTLSFAYAGPLDRFDHLLWKVITPGQISVTGAQAPQVQYSFDNGVTFSPSVTVPSTGIVDLYTYPGGFTRWHTGIRATFTQGTVAVPLYGAVRVAGATVNGDTVWTLADPSATITIVDGAGPVFSNVGPAVTLTCPVATATGQSIANFFNTSTSAATLAAKLYFSRVTPVGTGQGLMAAAAAAGAVNGTLNWTAKKPGTRIRHLVAGNNTVEAFVVAGNDVTLVSATDANGAETSTPNSVLVTLAANTAAAALLSATISGTGAGIIGNWSYTALPMALALNDRWTSYTTPPQMSLADLQTVWQTLRTSYLKTLSNVECIHICQDNIDNLTYQAFVLWLLGIKSDKKLPLWGFVQGLYRVPQVAADENLWAIAFNAALPSPRNTTVSYHGGEVDTLVSLYGCQLALNNATLSLARAMNVIISQSPSQVRCTVRSADGTQYAMPGSGLHSVLGGAEEQSALWEGDDALLELHAQNVVTARTVPKKDGVFIRQSLIYCEDGSPFIFWERRRVMNRAYNTTFNSLIDLLNANLLTNKGDGTLAEIEAQQIERTVIAALSSGGLLNDNGVNHVSAFDFSVSRVEQTAVTFNVDCALTIVPLAKAVTITESIGFAVTIGS